MTTQNATTKNATANTMSDLDLMNIIRDAIDVEQIRAARAELQDREDRARALANKNKIEREAADKLAEEKRQAQADFELAEAVKQYELVRAEVLPAFIAAAKVEQALTAARHRVERAAGAARSSVTCSLNPWALEKIKKILAYSFEKVGGGIGEPQREEIDRLIGAPVSLQPVAVVAPPPMPLSHREAFELCGLVFENANGVLRERISRSLSAAGAFQGKTFDQRSKLEAEALAKLQAKAAELGKVLMMTETPE